MPRSWISLPARLSATPSSMIPTRVYSGLRSSEIVSSKTASGTSRSFSKSYPHGESLTVRSLLNPCQAPAYLVVLRHTTLMPHSAGISYTSFEYLSERMVAMDTRNQQTPPDYGTNPDEHYEKAGLGAW